jgi:hypothetical protein
MTFRHGSRTGVLFDLYDVSTYMNSAQSSSSVTVSETTTYGATGDAKTYVTGLRDTTVSIAGLWDGDTGALDELINTSLASDNDANFLIAEDGGIAVGRRCIFGQSVRTKYSTDSPVADVVKISLDLQADAELGRGVILTDGASTTGNPGTVLGTAVDNGSATTNGGVGVVFNTINTRSAQFTQVKIQHSADNSTWADLVTFTNIPPNSTTPLSPLRSQRAVVATGTTVNRYLRATYTGSGATGAYAFVFAFARR